MLRIAISIFLAYAAACTPNAPWQADHSPATIVGADPPAVPVYAIEFDDQGMMWDAKQLRSALGAIDAFGSQHIIVITFIHGWKHNAKPDDSNLVAFTTELKKRASLEQYWAEKMNVPPRPLLGVYVGWRGQSLHLDPWITENLTFWSRKEAGLRVGSTSLTEAIFGIAKVTKDHNPSSQVVFVGHSFGGAVLERALAQAFVGILNRPAPADGSSEQFQSPVDLAVVVNPASSALQTRQLIDTLMRREVYVRKRQGTGHELGSDDPFGPPVLISITASNDWATGWAFPIGQYPITWTKAFTSLKEGPGERELFTHTGGHTPFLYSHSLVPVSANQTGPLVFHTKEGADGQAYALVRRQDAWNRSPYWVMEAPPDVIDGHNGIFTDAFGNLLETILDVGLVSGKQGAVRTELQANPGQRD
jgi:hypothetical protein